MKGSIGGDCGRFSRDLAVEATGGRRKGGMTMPSTSETHTALQPFLQPSDERTRIVALDILRGIAVFGIVLVNMPAFLGPALFYGPNVGVMSPLDEGIRLFFDLFVENRFYPIFSFLFGLGFYLFMRRAEDRGAAAETLYLRRTALLLLLGLAHLYLLWFGDILHTYALLGFALLFFYRRASKTILIWAAGLMGFGVLLMLPVLLLSAMGMEMGEAGDTSMALGDPERAASAIAVYQQGSLGEVLSFRWRVEIPEVWSYEGFSLLQVFPFMLFGFYAGRTGIAEEPGMHRKFLWRLFIGAFAVMLPLVMSVFATRSGRWSWGAAQPLIDEVWVLWSGWAMSLTYLAGFFLWSARPEALRPLFWLAPVGRMALSNYLLQTILATAAMWGFRLYGRAPLSLGLVLSLMIFVVNVLFSHFWMRRFRFGPLEWLWRMGTYGRRIPLRKALASRRRT